MGDDRVKVFIDGREVEVPGRVESLDAAKDALGVDRDAIIGLRVQALEQSFALLESEDGDAVTFWEFFPGQMYRSFPRDEVDWAKCFMEDSVTEAIAPGAGELLGDDDDEEDWGVVPDWE